MEYNRVYIHVHAVEMRLGKPIKQQPCSLCERTVSTGWCYNDKTGRLYCSKECAYRDTGEYYAAKQVTTLPRPRTSYSVEREYNKQIMLTRQIRLEAEELLDDIMGI